MVSRHLLLQIGLWVCVGSWLWLTRKEHRGLLRMTPRQIHSEIQRRGIPRRHPLVRVLGLAMVVLVVLLVMDDLGT